MKKRVLVGVLIALTVVVICGTTIFARAAFNSYYHSNDPDNRKSLGLLFDSGDGFFNSWYEYTHVWDADSTLIYTFDYHVLGAKYWYDKELRERLDLDFMTFDVSVDESWGSRTAEQFNAGLQFNIKKIVNFVGGYQRVNEHTVQYKEAQKYKHTLSENSPTGWYYFAAIMDFDAYEVEKRKVEQPLFGKAKTTTSNDTVLVFLHEDAWIQFVYQDHR
jgi:hypothetical protein